ncbi:hypothetical protein FB451DRAFT_1198307 [Mycena latifolia]|nr:hypothetical protein FB451DRAFT_1198307 [Mycena latifolia]
MRAARSVPRRARFSVHPPSVLRSAFLALRGSTFLPTYPFLNPSKQHARLAAYIIGIALGDVVVFFFTRSIILLRTRVFASRNKEGRADELTDGEGGGGREELEDWEEVERPGQGNGVARKEAAEAVAAEP